MTESIYLKAFKMKEENTKVSPITTKCLTNKNLVSELELVVKALVNEERSVTEQISNLLG